MADHLTKAGRSVNMSKIRSKNTNPEKAVKKTLNKLKVKYRSHRKSLPGKPDFWLVGTKKLIFVNGCFWHCCPLKRCKRSNVPKSNKSYWEPKLKRNVQRDKKNLRLLKSEGWQPVIIWECQTKKLDILERKVSRIAEK